MSQQPSRQEGSSRAGLGGSGGDQAYAGRRGEPGPGEEGTERRTDEWFVRRLLMLEETVVRRGRDGQKRDGRGNGGQEKDGRGSWDGHKGW